MSSLNRIRSNIGSSPTRWVICDQCFNDRHSKDSMRSQKFWNSMKFRGMYGWHSWFNIIILCNSNDFQRSYRRLTYCACAGQRYRTISMIFKIDLLRLSPDVVSKFEVIKFTKVIRVTYMKFETILGLRMPCKNFLTNYFETYQQKIFY